jgi:L-lactate dehydrogenase
MKVGVVGTGFVGATAAYAMVMAGVGRELVLVDKNTARAQAEADDIFHAVPFAHPLRVRAGDYAALTGSRVVVIAAGVNQKPGETRLQLLSRNAAIFREVVPAILAVAPEAVLVVATNPVDIMTHLTARIAAEHGTSAGRVFGSGTTLDTARFRALLGRHLGVDPQHVHAYVIGEHGDSEVLTWSLINIGGIPLADYCTTYGVALDEAAKAEIDRQVRRAAYHIIEGKAATYYGIGAALARIVDVILSDQRAILTICSPQVEVAGVSDVTLALPHLLGGAGILETFPLPLSLSAEEAVLLHKSATTLRAVIDDLDTERADA